MSRLLSLSIFILSSISLLAQSVAWEHSHRNYLSNGSALCQLPNGNIIAVGHGALQTNASVNTYVQCLDTAGNLIWQDSVATLQSARYHASSWAGIDPSGDIWILGYRYILTNSSGNFIETPDAIRVWKYSPSGQLLFQMSFPGTFGSGQTTNLGNGLLGAFDERGNFYISGTGATQQSGPGQAGFLLMKLDSSGMKVWEKSHALSNVQQLRDADYRNGTIVQTGTTQLGGRNNVVMKWDTTGQLIWSSHTQNTNQAWATSILQDDNENTYTLAQAYVVGGTQIGNRIMLTRYDAAGDTVYTRFFPASQSTTSGRMAWLPNGNLLLAGTNWSTFPPNTLYVYEVEPLTGDTVYSREVALPEVTNYVYDIVVAPGGNYYITGKSDNNGGAPAYLFLVAFDARGQLQWVDQYNQTTATPLSLVVDNQEQLYLVGRNSFSVVKWNHKVSQSYIVLSQSDTICDGDEIVFGGMVLSAAGEYRDTVQSAQSIYDTVHILQLAVVTSPATTLSQQGNLLVANDSTFHSYQWWDCQSQSVIPGAVLHTYSPGSTGSFALITSNGICTDTTDCYKYIPTGISYKTPSIQIFPNPASSAFRVQNSEQANVVYLRVWNSMGQLVYDAPFHHQSISIESWKAGPYVIELKLAGGKLIIVKLIVH